MDEKLARRINRQLRAIKVTLGFFALLLIALLAIMGFIAYKVVTFTNNIETKVTNLQQTTQQKLDIKQQLCDSGSNTTLLSQLCD